MNPSAQRDVQTKLTKNLLDLIILTILENHPMHGYELMTTVRKSYGVSFGASTIYPMLSEIEKKHLIKSEWNTNVERPRKTYMLTDEGRRMLDFSANTLKVICSSIVSVGKMPGRELPHEIQVIPHYSP